MYDVFFFPFLIGYLKKDIHTKNYKQSRNVKKIIENISYGI